MEMPHCTWSRPATPRPLPARYRHQRGVSLIVVLLLLTVASVLGVGGAQIAMMAERSARNDRDAQVAWQAAEAALLDAEYDIGATPATGNRGDVLNNPTNINLFVTGCGKSSDNLKSIGLCTLVDTGKPAWLTVDFTVTGSDARTTQFGTYTKRSFAAGAAGVQPSKAPRYVIEAIPDSGNRDLSSVKYIFRVTAMGFGPRADIQAMTQSIYRN